MDNDDTEPKLEGIGPIALEQVIGTDALQLQKAHSEAHLQRVKLLNGALAVTIAFAVAVAPALIVWVWRWAL